MAKPTTTYQQAYAGIMGKLRINGRVTPGNVPQLQFSPSVGIIARDIDKLGMDIRSFHEPLKRAVQKVIIPSIQANFDAEGRPTWEPYSDATIEIRDNMHQPVGKMLEKTGMLRQTMKQLNLWTINQNAAILLDLPPNIWYGKIHQGGFGGTSMKSRIKKAGGSHATAFHGLQKDIKGAIKAGKTIRQADFSIPARPFVMIQPEDEDAIAEIFIKWLQERIDRHWSRRG